MPPRSTPPSSIKPLTFLLLPSTHPSSSSHLLLTFATLLTQYIIAAMEDDGFVMPVNPSKPPPLYWGEVTIVKAGDPRRGQVGYIRKRDSIKRPNGQWNYHVSFPDVEETIEYQHDELFMGRA